LISSEVKERLVEAITLLNVPGIGRGRFRKLVNRFDSVSDVLTASHAALVSVPTISERSARAIRTEADPDQARQLAARIAQLGWDILFWDSPDYPSSLGQIDSAPPLLFRIGLPADDDGRMIAIVGTRHASEGLRRFTHHLAGELVQAGITVVSGMAEGIDSSAHRGALKAGGRTVAVWGTPLDQVYPTSNRELAKDIMDNGLVYSEYFPDSQPSSSNFPERNRIISGLAEGVIVVEAGKKSGALITANYAIEQQRELFAVPGGPGSPQSFGCNQLIKEGARLLTGVQDVFDELPRLKGTVSARRFRQLPDMTEDEQKMVDLLSGGPIQIDQLSRESKLTVTELMGYLLALELKGVVQELSGKRFVLTDR